MITWRQLGLHHKPVLVCDVAGSAQPLLAAIEAAIARGFASPQSRALFEVLDGVTAVLGRIQHLSVDPRSGAERL